MEEDDHSHDSWPVLHVYSAFTFVFNLWSYSDAKNNDEWEETFCLISAGFVLIHRDFSILVDSSVIYYSYIIENVAYSVHFLIFFIFRIFFERWLEFVWMCQQN